MIIYQILYSLSNFDILPIKNLLIMFDFSDVNTPFNAYFANLGYKTNNLMLNLGFLFFIGLGLIPILAFYPIFSLF